MKTLTLACILILPTLAFANCQEFINQITGPYHEYVTHLVVDGDDNIIVAGTFRNTAEIQGHTLTGGGNNDVFLIKLNQTGSVIWATALAGGGSSFDFEPYLFGLEVDQQNNILLNGNFREHLAHGNDTLYGDKATNNFIVKLNGSGQLLWKQKVEANNEYNSLGNLRIDKNGNLVWSILANDTFWVNNQAFFPSGNQGLFTLHFSPFGSFLQASEILSSNGSGYSSAHLFDHEIWVSGNFENNTVLFLKDTTITFSAGNDEGIFFLILDSNYNFKAINIGNGFKFDFVSKLKKGSDNNFYAAGFFRNTLSFGQHTVSVQNPGIFLEQDIFLMKLDNLGNVVWLKNHGSDRRPTGFSDFVLGSNNHLYVYGDFNHNLKIGGKSLSSKAADLYIAEFSTDGSLVNVFHSEAKEAVLSRSSAGGIGLNSKGEILASASFSWETYIRDTLVKNTTLRDGLVFKLCDLTTSTSFSTKPTFKASIFPNPAREVLHISMKEYQNIGKVTILNLNGQILYRENFTSNEAEIRHSLPKGFYIISIENETGIQQKKLIIAP